MKSNTTRFSDRVDDYEKYRPGYPTEIISILQKQIDFDSKAVVADIGSGTGKLSELFLRKGNIVFGVEPNTEMRQAAELTFAGNPHFISVNGTAEQSTLKEKSIDLITCGQSFHWFDPDKTKTEFTRILEDNGHMLLIWNERNEKDAFMKKYDALLSDQVTEYQTAASKQVSIQKIKDFFHPRPLQYAVVDHFQSFDLGGLKGRLLSSSYCPKEGSIYDALMSGLEILFDEFQQNGVVLFEYKTKMYYC